MHKNFPFQSGNLNPRVLVAFVLCSVGALLVTLSVSFVTPRASAQPTIVPLPSTGMFTAVGGMSSGRDFHTATLLANGKVLVAGGFTGPNTQATDTAELFDPASGIFTPLTHTMISRRYQHTATLLPNGKVLITGGYVDLTTGSTKTAELFDPASGTFSALVSTMSSDRYYHTATLLPNGKVLVVGGFSNSQPGLNTADLFDPATETFTPLPGIMTSPRFGHSSTVLRDGKVLIAGGNTGFGGVPGFGGATNTAELFDPTSNTFASVLLPMTVPRYYHTATLLSSGKVLLAGGFTGLATGTTDTAELFDPTLGTFTVVGPMASARGQHTATLLPSGKVIVAAGQFGLGEVSNMAELFDPTTQTFSLIPNMMNSGRVGHTATLLTSGDVLMAGGYTGAGPLNSAELFDSASRTFASLSGTMTSARYNHTSTLLSSGKVLIAGGNTGSAGVNTAELFDPALASFVPLLPMSSVRASHTATLLPTGKVLLAGGATSSGATNTAEFFDPASQSFASLPSSMTLPREGHTATLLANGKVLLVGGSTSTGSTNTAELFDSGTGSFTALASTMSSARSQHTATLLPNGKVLIAGGRIGSTASNTADLFDPTTATFTSVSPNTMSSARFNHTATLLPNGKVLFAGGSTGVAISNTAELFDPAAGTFTSLPNNMTSARYLHTATLLSIGKVLIAGGSTASGGSAAINTAEVFDPATDTFTALSPNTMNSPRSQHRATLLPNGNVLVAGGSTNNGSATDGPNGGITNTAELFDEGLGFSDARRPVLSTAPNPLVQPAAMVLSGAGFRGDSDGAGGSFQSSATNYPIAQLMRLDNEQTIFPLSNPAANWSDTTFTSETLGVVTPLPAGAYRVTIFTNAIPSFQKIIYIKSATPVQLVSVVSRKTHGTAGDFDVDLTPPINGIECRSGGANSDYTMIFTFPVNMTSCGVASAGIASSGPNANQCTVQLTGVPNAQFTTVQLTGVIDSNGSTGNVSGSMGVLIGDTNADGFVNSADIAQTKSQSGQFVTSSNFREDVTVDGNLNSGDIALVKSKSGTALP